MIRRRAITFLLAFILIFTCALAPAFAATEEELRQHEAAAEAAREAAEAAQTEAERLAAEVEALDETIAALQSDIDARADDIEIATERVNILQAEVEDLQAKIEQKQAEIDTTQVELDRQEALLAARIESSYKSGNDVYLQLLLDSTDIEDFIARTELVMRVIESNHDLTVDLEDTRIAIEKAQAAVERYKETVDQKLAEAEAERNRLTDLRDQQQAKLDEQESTQNNKSALVAENEANAARLIAQAEAEEAESERIAEELYGTGSGYFSGVMKFPVPGWEQTPSGGSAFGWRIHPILGYKKFHTGIDIGSSAVGKNINGATIVAAADGEVIYAAYRGGYGYCTMIDHGNGIVTLYAHQQAGSLKVSVGDTVTRGQAIGKVGTTGLSTGPHLHFEVRLNGTPVDPMEYLD